MAQSLHAYEVETEEQFPQDPAVQLDRGAAVDGAGVGRHLGALVASGQGRTADAGLGLVVQEMAFGVGQGQCGSGVLQLVDTTPACRRSPGAT